MQKNEKKMQKAIVNSNFFRNFASSKEKTY